MGFGKRTITGLLCAGAELFRDWTAAYRLFSADRLNPEALFAPARAAVIENLKVDEPLTVMFDDTIVRKRGLKVHGTGWKRDPLGPKFRPNFVWSQRFLQLSAALPDAECLGRARGIPIDLVHAPSPLKPKKKAPPEDWQKYRQQQQQQRVTVVAADRLQQLRQQVEAKRKIICSVDGGFTNRSFFRDVPVNTVLIGRIRKDARLFAPPDTSGKQGKGRQRYYGHALPTPEELRQDDSIAWIQVEAYAAGKRHQFDVKHQPAVRWKGCGNKTVQVLIIRPLAYRTRKGSSLLYRHPAYLLCTDETLPLNDLLQAYLWRWEIELNFRDEKTVMGTGQAQVRKPKSVEAVPQFMVATYSYLLLAGNAAKTNTLPRPKWQKQKEGERTTTQMFQNLFRAQLWDIAITENKNHFNKNIQKNQTRFFYQKSLEYAACYAFK